MNARPVLWAGAADAAAAVRQQCPQAAADALARAGEICEHTFLFRDHWEMEPTREPVHFDGPVVWDAVPAGDPEWIYALNRHTIFVNLGKAWQYTGQARYLDAFVSLLEDWLDRVPRTPASENTTWRALEAGLRPENWLRALGRLEENLRHAVLPDGVQWEQSPMYHCVVLHAALDTLLLAQRNGVPVPPALPEKALAMCRALAVWAAPDRTILPQGDSDVIDAGDLLAAGAPSCSATHCWRLRPGALSVRRRCGISAPTLRPGWTPCRRRGRKRRPRRWRSAATTSSAPAGEKRTPMSTSTPGAWGAATGTRTCSTSTYITAGRPS